MSDREADRQLVFSTIGDLVSHFMYYDRKEDEKLPRGRIEELVENGTLTVDEIVDMFAHELKGSA